MANKIKEEYNSLMKDVEKNFQNKEDVKYLKTRMPQLIENISNEIEDLKKKMKTKEKEMSTIKKKQKDVDSIVERMQNVIDHLENVIYEEFFSDDEDIGFEIVK